jgi:hypothetical protein
MDKDIQNELPPVYLKCWQLTQHILNRWSTLVPFYVASGQAGYVKTHDPRSAREMQMATVYFFVPKEATNRFEITRFLDRETTGMNREASEPVTIGDETITMFGTEVGIYTMVFESSLMEPYLTEGQRHRVQAEMFKQLERIQKKAGPVDEIVSKIAEGMRKAHEKKPVESNPEDDGHMIYGISPEDLLKHFEEEEEDGQ